MGAWIERAFEPGDRVRVKRTHIYGTVDRVDRSAAGRPMVYHVHHDTDPRQLTHPYSGRELMPAEAPSPRQQVALQVLIEHLDGLLGAGGDGGASEWMLNRTRAGRYEVWFTFDLPLPTHTEQVVERVEGETALDALARACNAARWHLSQDAA